MTRKKTESPLPTITPVRLTAAAVQAFATLAKDQQTQRKLRKRISRARLILKRAFGDHFIGVTPDGRLIQRSAREREYDPLPAKIVTEVSYQELPAPGPAEF